VKGIAIVGAGLAGLSCAHRLRRRGLDATVFEASADPGGRTVGAFYLLPPQLFRNTFQLIDDAGLRGEIVPIPPHAGQLYKGRVYHHRVSSAAGLLSFKGIGLIDKALLPRMVYLLARHSSDVDFHHPDRGLDFDNETVAAFVKRELSQNILNYVAGPLISTLFFYGSDETSAWLYLVLAKHMQNLEMSTLRGGLRRLAAALSRDLHIVRGTTIRGIAKDGQTYIVAGERFSDLVIAVPGDTVLQIAGLESLLSEADVAFFRDCSYQRVVSVEVETPKPIDGRCYALSIPRVEKLSAATISFNDYIDPSTVPDGRGRATITGGGAGITAEKLLQDLRAIYRVDPAHYTTVEWTSGMPMLPPGRYRAISEFRKRERHRRLFFCGDYLLAPLIEGAITTGLDVAESVIQP
jgi:oxygen-dependent protoporphyrinogen oxidase